jgi:hypothetical protein
MLINRKLSFKNLIYHQFKKLTLRMPDLKADGKLVSQYCIVLMNINLCLVKIFMLINRKLRLKNLKNCSII